MTLASKVCLITGGSSGMGAATAREFARRGAEITICGLPADEALSPAVMACASAIACGVVKGAIPQLTRALAAG